jgi:proteasome lid subunit RPN8/RPN11
MVTRCTISRSALAAIRAHAVAAAPREACGLLLGSDTHVDRAIECANLAADPHRHFEVDPATLFSVLRAEREGGARWIGCYHSHPTGDARPSIADAKAAAPDGRLWLIVGPHDVTAWRAGAQGAVNGRFDRLELLAVGESLRQESAPHPREPSP